MIEIAAGVMHVGPDTISDPGLCSELSPGPYVFVEVTDNGCGFPTPAGRPPLRRWSTLGVSSSIAPTRDKYRVVIVDLTMPVATGRDVLRDLRAHPRPVPVLLMSGFSEGDIALADAGPARAGFLQKPFSVEGLRRWLASLLDHPVPG